MAAGDESNNNLIQEQKTAVSVSTFVSALVLNVVLTVVIYLAFCILRPRNRNVYAPRTYLAEESKRSPALPRGPFAWIMSVLKAPDEELLYKIGLDAYMLLRFLRTCVRIFAVLTFFSWVIIVPLNTAVDGTQRGLDVLTMGNIPDNQSKRLWGHLIVFIGFILFILYTLVTELDAYVVLRHRYLTSREHRREPRSVTLLVTGVPKKLHDEAKLRELFDVFPGGVEHVVLACNPSGAIAKYNARNGAVLSVEAAECAYVTSGQRPSARSKSAMALPIPKLGESEDAIKYSRSRLLELQRVLDEERARTDRAIQPSAFIVFRSQRGAQLAAQAVTSAKPLHMSERWSEVHPDDVIWSNLTIGGIHRWWRKAVSIAICTGLIISWAIIVTFVTGISQISSLITVLPFLNVLTSYPKLTGIIQGILPPVAIAVLMMVLAFILLRLTIFEGTPLGTAAQLSLMHKYYFFLVVNVLLVVTFSGGIFASIDQIKNNPTSVLSVLAVEMPRASSFFVNYMLLQGLTSAAKELLMIAPMVIKWIKRRALVKTPRQIWELKAMPTFSWGATLPQHTLSFAIGITYCVIAPLVLPFTLIYFTFYYFVYRYQFLYVLDQPSHAEMGGRAFPVTVAHIFAALYIAEVTMIGIFALRVEVGQIVLILLLLLITVVANLYTERAFKQLLSYVPLETLLEADRGDGMSMAEASKAHRRQSSLFKTLQLPFNKSTGAGHDEEAAADNKNEQYTELLTGQSGGAGLAKVSDFTFMHPALGRPGPIVWLPKDKGGLAVKECDELLGLGIAATTEGAMVRDNGRVGLTVDEVPLYDEVEAHHRVLSRQQPSTTTQTHPAGLISFASSSSPLTSQRAPGSNQSHSDVATNTRVEHGPNGETIIVEETITTTTDYVVDE